MRLVVIVLACGLAGLGCSLSESAPGSDCVRTAQCGAGLACVEGKCSTHLRPIADRNTTPDLGLGDAAMGAPDAAGDATVGGSRDAATSVLDAGGGGAAGGSPPAPNPDAAISGNDAG